MIKRILFIESAKYTSTQRLEVRIRQHVPSGFITQGRQTSGHSQAMESTIGDHLLAIDSCRTNYQDDCFSVLRIIIMSCHQRGYP